MSEEAETNGLRIAGRHGWARMFPFMEERGRILELPLEVG